MHSEHVNKHLLQGFGGVKEIKLMGREKYFSNAFSEHNRQYNSIIVKNQSGNYESAFKLLEPYFIRT